MPALHFAAESTEAILLAQKNALADASTNGEDEEGTAVGAEDETEIEGIEEFRLSNQLSNNREEQ